MSLENPNIVDFISMDPKSGTLTLTISDHLDWADHVDKHVEMLQQKIEKYLNFIERGEIYSSYPKARGNAIRIEIVGQFPLTSYGSEFLDYAKEFVIEAGATISFRHLAT